MRYIFAIMMVTASSLNFAIAADKKSAAAPSKCTAANAEKSIHMNSVKFWKVVQNKPETLYFVDTEKCFLPNQKINLFETKNGDGFVYWRAPRGTVKVQKVENINFSEYKKREVTKTTEKEMNNFRKRVVDFTGKKASEIDSVPIIAVTVLADKLTDSLKTGGSPRFHPAAKSLKKKQFVDEVKNNHAYDIRPAALKKKGPLKYANVLEYIDYTRIASEILSPEEMSKLKIRFSKNTLPKNKSEPISIISGCPGEYSAYNTITLLTSMGYKNISWFPGGMSEYGKKAQPCLTPEKPPVAPILEASQVREMIQDKKHNEVIDVRSEKRFSLVGAKPMGFPEKRNALSMPLYRSSITAEGLVSHKEGYKGKIQIGANKNIILVGENEYDWRPLKAAIYLKSKGYKNIYWYRMGMKDWAQKVLFHPELYKLNRAVKSGELY
ncbi:MAG: rhodanese-like domain-containing protein [Bdellovibrionales bacterium]|nr:rhodanese-like domain-containing protein [Bdellovibrionales bacterium]